jgi:2-iminobutanoate/2-iminopropanoate deaminase
MKTTTIVTAVMTLGGIDRFYPPGPRYSAGSSRKEPHVTRKAFSAPGAVAVGPYSHAVECGDTVFLSGQTPLDSATGALVQGGIAAQAEQCFRNLFAVLAAAGLGPDDVVKANVYLVDMADFGAMNAVYERQFSRPFPARTTIGVASLPLGARIEIELVARRPRP